MDHSANGNVPMARARVGAIEVQALTEAEVAEHVTRGWRDGTGGAIVTANVDIVRAATRAPELAALVAGSELVVADGMPVVWAARIAGLRLPDRVTGASLVFTLTGRAAREGRSVFLLGGEPGVPERAGEVLAARYPGLRVAGAYAPPFGFERDPGELAATVALVRAAAPDLVLVGLGFPKQERVIAVLRPELPHAWYLGCGAGIPMAAGRFRRAPRALQRTGAEWLFRLALEPRRLARRYLRDDLPFAFGLLASAAWRRLTADRRP
ncbi:WecB/TagA/CpsF family glycosyltransferase [Nonomuraea candida]|uniref:WecB/TagA/CpsF family glycosyltransferase n=1 Tax=Nonomuraea candida TaxID=359159 RepID=UPI000B076A0E|nr:WecB/TagA/CpsF family glycosyltransferase [Nonomuraea candida]